MKTLAIAIALLLPASLVLAASGDVIYVKKGQWVTLSGPQVTSLVSFIGQISPELTAANAVAITCIKQGSSVLCQAQATNQAAPSQYITDQVAGLVTSTTSVVP